MKKLLLMALAIMPFIVRAQSEFTINGQLGSAAPGLIYLSYMVDGKTLVDSVKPEKGVFQFKGTVPGPTMSYVFTKAASQGVIPDNKVVYIEGGAISFVSTDSIKNAVVTGSALHTQYEAYAKEFETQDRIMNSVNADYAAASPEKKGDPVFAMFLQEKFKVAAQEKMAILQKYIALHPDSYFSLIALKEIANNNVDMAIIGVIFKTLTEAVRTTREGTELGRLIAATENTSIGVTAPDFTQTDPDGKPVKLSDFRGKYVLIDFWASWCKPCRDENPNVVKVFKTYKDKNFTILGVSLDQPGKREDWLAAIKKDKLSWAQVSDLKFWKNDVALLYGVRSIPQNFLLDPEGKIIGKNLSGQDLEKKLAEVIH
jgi:peroxiredoxin